MTGKPRNGILVVGESLIDRVVGGQRGVKESPGGSPLNVAVGLGRLGNPVQLLTSLGADDRGTLIRRHLDESGVLVHPDSTQMESTSTATANIQPDGSAAYGFDISWELPSAVTAGDALIVHTGSLGAALAPGDAAAYRLFARSRGRTVTTFDPNVRPTLMRPHPAQIRATDAFIAAADVVKLSDEDGAWLYPDLDQDDVIDRALNLGASLVAVTRGPAGATVATTAHRVHVTSDADVVSDTIGAGDSFMAGLIHGIRKLLRADHGTDTLRNGTLLDRAQLEELGRFASDCARITVSRPGADLPWARELVAPGVGVKSPVVV
ncbi:carbohydrate kinase family protein [Microbacterium lacusdiani]